MAGGEVGFLLEDVLVLRRLLGMLDLPDLLTLGGVGDVLGLLLADVAGCAVGAHRRVEQREGSAYTRGQQQGREKAGVHEGSRPFTDPEHAVVRGVAAQGAPRFGDRDGSRGGEVPADLYQNLPRKNFIDDLAWKKLASLGITPSDSVEDARFLRGIGCYVDDIELPGLQEVAFLRSPLAHARILSIRKPQGAEPSVFAAEDLDIRAVQAKLGLPGFKSSEYPPLARGKVRFVGEAVAMCVAATRAEGEDLADRIELELEPLPAVADPRTSLPRTRLSALAHS